MPKQRDHRVARLRAAQAALACGAEDHGHADSDRFSVRKRKAAGRLNGVAEGMAQIEHLPRTAVKLVALDKVPLHLHAPRRHLLQPFAGGNVRQKRKQLPAAQYRVFDDLRAAVEENFARQRV